MVINKEKIKINQPNNPSPPQFLNTYQFQGSSVLVLGGRESPVLSGRILMSPKILMRQIFTRATYWVMFLYPVYSDADCCTHRSGCSLEFGVFKNLSYNLIIKKPQIKNYYTAKFARSKDCTTQWTSVWLKSDSELKVSHFTLDITLSLSYIFIHLTTKRKIHNWVGTRKTHFISLHNCLLLAFSPSSNV